MVKRNPRNLNLDFLIKIHHEDGFQGGEIRFRISRSIAKNLKSGFQNLNRDNQRKIRRRLFTSSIKREVFSRRSRAETAEKRVLLYNKPIAFLTFSLLSPSPLLRLPRCVGNSYKFRSFNQDPNPTRECRTPLQSLLPNY